MALSKKWRCSSLAVLSALTLAACGAEAGGNSSAEESAPIRVGAPLSLTGPFGIYGKMVKDGLEAGLACATDHTGEVDGRPVEFVFEDDAMDPAKSLTAATGMVGDGMNIITGTVSSAAAVQLGEFAAQNDVLYVTGNAGADAHTGLNDNTFRGSRQSYQEAAALAALAEDPGAKVVVLAQDYTFGQGYVDTLSGILGEKGAEVEPVLVPLEANEFTPFARRVVEAEPDVLLVIYYGETTAAMWQALQQQGVLENTKVGTLLVEKTNWSIYGDAAEDITYVTHYFPGSVDTDLNDCLVEQVPDADLSTHDGFVAAQMVVHALTEAGPDDVTGMIAALDGWTFEAPKGEMTVREGDHAMMQEMFIASLAAGAGGELEAKLVSKVPAEVVAPPQAGGK